MTRRQIDSSREVRLWIGQILIPAIGVTMMFPEARDWVNMKVDHVRQKIRAWMNKT